MADCRTEQYRVCSITMRFPPGQVAQAKDLLRSVTGPIAAKSGCRLCRFTWDANDDCVLIYEEYWDVDTDLGRHVRSEDFRPVLVAMDLCAVLPEVRIGRFHCCSGMDALHSLWSEDLEAQSFPG